MKREQAFYFIAKRCSAVLKKAVPDPVRLKIKEWIIGKNISSFLKDRQSFESEKYQKGINLIGCIRAEMGLGQSCRLVARQLEKSDMDFSIRNVGFDGDLREKDSTYDTYLSDELPYGINLFHVNPCELGKVFMSMPETWRGHYNIAFWLWELEEFPDEWVKYSRLFDEIWTPSEFAGRGIRKKTDIPVKTVPYSVVAPCDESCTRETLGLPRDKFLYLIMYDSNSTSGRKNPQGAIEAYKMAFPEERQDCGLVIKVNNARKDDIDRLKAELSDYKNVYYITDILKKEEVNSLIRCTDVFISLHRAEGFGLVMAEAMLLGTPVIATDWSSNTEFMSSDACCMVGYRLVSNPHTEGLYRKGCIWAEPDITEAAEYIVRLKAEPDYYREKCEKGRQCVDQKLNEKSLLQLWNQNLYEAWDRQQKKGQTEG